MTQLASLLRFLQLFAHAAHHLAHGCSFFEDHKFLGKLYGEYEEAFDSLVERLIGLGELEGVKDRLAIDSKAASILSKTESETLADPEDWFELLLEMEQELCGKIDKLAEGKISQGTLNLLAGLADASEQRQYKIGQRIKPCCSDNSDEEEIERAY